MMLMGLRALAADPDTKVIVLISKPPEEAVLGGLTEALKEIDKPVVTCFLGAHMGVVSEKTYRVEPLQEAALKAVQLAGVSVAIDSPFLTPEGSIKQKAAAEGACFAPAQKYVRGLFSGGTLCYEAMLLLESSLGQVYSKASLDSQYLLTDPEMSREHTLIDMGDDYFTDGRPHPIIDPSFRVERFRREAADPETAVILLDIMLGYGSHADPGGALVPAIEEAKTAASRGGRHLSVVASVCGTPGDPQNLQEQEERLRRAGVIVMPSNAQAAAMAAAIISGSFNTR
jgi:FdrA protein